MNPKIYLIGMLLVISVLLVKATISSAGTNNDIEYIFGPIFWGGVEFADEIIVKEIASKSPLIYGRSVGC